MVKIIFLYILFLLSALCAFEWKDNILIGEKKLSIEIADEPQEREQGLMFVRNLEDNHGMLFVFDYPDYLGFWMKNTYIPLSIAFIDENGFIIDIQDMEPLSEVTITSKRRALYALEVKKGWFADNAIFIGDKVEF